MNHKELLLEKGAELFATQAYNATGIRQITQSIGIPTGSFHYHFKNKEEFTIAILDEWFNKEFKPIGNEILFNQTLNAKQKLLQYFQVMIDYYIEKSNEYGVYSNCMLGNLGQELANDNSTIIKKVRQLYAGFIYGIQTLIQLGQQDESIKTVFRAEKMAPFIFDAYEGALLRRKIEQSNQPLTEFLKTLDSLI